jgi:hypothetical protein
MLDCPSALRSARQLAHHNQLVTSKLQLALWTALDPSSALCGLHQRSTAGSQQRAWNTNSSRTQPSLIYYGRQLRCSLPWQLGPRPDPTGSALSSLTLNASIHLHPAALETPTHPHPHPQLIL